MWNRKFKKTAAVIMAASVTMAAGAHVLPTALNAIAEEAQEQEQQISLALGDDAQQGLDAAGEKQTETETETETEAKVEYETLETTKTEGHTVTAIDVSDIVKASMPSVVSITSKSIQEVQDYFYGTQQYEAEGRGSGFIIAQSDTELMIATNNHVVEGSNSLTVGFSVEAEKEDDLLVPAVIKGYSSKNDLAVVAVKLADIPEDIFKQLRIATLGNSTDLKIGEAAILIGNALGEGQTVSTGVVSALEHDITTEAGTFSEFQIDAGVNLGCSGGPILDGEGKVIGIFNAKAVSDYAENMGYGIPITTAIPVLTDMINRETRETVENHGYLGITVVPVSEEAKQMYDMPAGAYVYEVSEGSAAEAAGIAKGDIITSLDGIDIDSADSLVSTLGYYSVGETVKLEVMTNKGGSYEAREVEVTLQEGANTDSQSQETESQPQPRPEDQENFRNEDFDFDDFGQFFFGDGFGQDNRDYGYSY